MKSSDVLTVGVFQQLLAQLVQPQQAVRLLTLQQVCEELQVDRTTVSRWINKGKKGRFQNNIKLQVYHFGDAEPRIPWPALAAFGQGLAFDLDTLSGLVPANPAMRAA